jgi:uncharacterized membrane protein YebE (DUF533 family)
MKRHDLDVLSFLSGLTFGAIAVAYLLATQQSRDIDGRWVLPGALIALGLAGIAGAVSSLRRSEAQNEVDEDARSEAPGDEITQSETADL